MKSAESAAPSPRMRSSGAGSRGGVAARAQSPSARLSAELATATTWITREVLAHPDDLAAVVQARLSVSRRRAATVLRHLQEQGWLHAQRLGRHTRYQPGSLRQVVAVYSLQGLEEDLPWRRDFVPYFEMSGPVAERLGQAFSELLNNAIEHSGGQQVSISLRQTPDQLQLLMADDGVGLFQHLSETLDLQDPALALLEISKGRLTSQPLHHCGHGLLLSARLADVFHVQANGRGWLSQHHVGGHWEAHSLGSARPGTSVYLSVSRSSMRSLEDVLAAWRADGQQATDRAEALGASEAPDERGEPSHPAAGADFSRTRVPLRLLVLDQPSSMLHSRADARRVTHRLTEFALAELDFEGIEALGPAFADELLRVWAPAHPHVRLACVHATPPVQRALQRAR